MTALLEIILPVFLVIAAGYSAARWGGFSQQGVDGVMKFAQSFAVPLLLFRSISGIDIAQDASPGLFLSFYIGAFSCFFIGSFCAKYLLKRSGEECVAIGFAAMFSNALLLGAAITERAYGSQSLAGNFSIIAIHTPIFYISGLLAMELVRGNTALPGQEPKHGLAKGAHLIRTITIGVLRQPIALGVLAGLIFNLLHIPTPKILGDAMDMLVRAALPAALFGLGGVLRRYKPEGDSKTIVLICVLSLLIHPSITYILAKFVFELDTNLLRSAVLTASMAPGINAYLFADLYGVSRRANASAILVGTALSILTIWVWLHILP